MIDQQTIDDAVGRLLGAAPPGSEVILFGSYATGNAREDSDLDFLVIEAQVPDRHHEMVRLRQALRGIPIGVDIIVASRQVFDEWKDTPNNVLHEAWKEGRVYREVG